MYVPELAEIFLANIYFYMALSLVMDVTNLLLITD